MCTPLFTGGVEKGGGGGGSRFSGKTDRGNPYKAVVYKMGEALLFVNDVWIL